MNARSLLKSVNEPFYRNSASIIANSLFGTFFGLVFWIVAARLVGAGDIGLAIATISAATFLTSLSRLGMDDVLVRFLPGARDRSALYGPVLITTLALALAFTGAFLCLIDYVSPSLGYLREGWYLLSFVFYMATVSVYTTQNTTLLALRRADRSLVQNALLSFRIPLLLLIGSAGAIGIFVSFNLSYLAALALGLLYLLNDGFRLQIGHVRAVLKTVREHLAYSVGNYLSAIFTMMPATLLPIVIMNTTGPVDVAYFYVAYSIAALLFIIPNAVAMSLFIEGSHDMPLAAYTTKAFKLIFVIVLPLVAVLLLCGDRLLLLFSREYAEQSIGLLRLLLVASLFCPAVAVFSAVRRVEKNVRSLNRVSLSSAVLLVGLGYAGLSIYGLPGLGYAWIATYGALAVALLAVLLREGKLFRAGRK